MERAADVAERVVDRLVLAAAVADRPEVEYGWIQPGEVVGGYEDIRAVSQFHENPIRLARRIFFATATFGIR